MQDTKKNLTNMDEMAPDTSTLPMYWRWNARVICHLDLFRSWRWLPKSPPPHPAIGRCGVVGDLSKHVRDFDDIALGYKTPNVMNWLVINYETRAKGQDGAPRPGLWRQWTEKFDEHFDVVCDPPHSHLPSMSGIRLRVQSDEITNLWDCCCAVDIISHIIVVVGAQMLPTPVVL